MRHVTSPNISLAGLILFGPKLAPLCKLIHQLSQDQWQDHPPLYTAAPALVLGVNSENVISCRETGWVSMLREALLALRARRPDVQYVLSYIEDHCPLRRLDHERLGRYIQIAIQHQFKCVSFVTYRWPWSETHPDSVDEHGRTMTWKKLDVLEIDGFRFARVPTDFFRYNQCQPSLWSIDYYLSLCDVALSQGIDDAWTFEATTFEHQFQHYIADYPWPSVHHGFMAQGMVNPEAIRFANRSNTSTKALQKYMTEKYIADLGLKSYISNVFVTPWMVEFKKKIRRLISFRNC